MAGNDVRTVRVRIEGRVQGVGYRYWAERTAAGLGLSGWVRNRRDGSVEAVLSGTPEVLARMLDLCRSGPPAAEVDAVTSAEETEVPAPGFTTRPTG